MAKKNIKKGVFITFEGPEGCGKSTHSRLLRDFLKAGGYECLLTREPGGTRAGEEIRRVLLDSAGAEMSSLTELFLFEAARSQIVEELIVPSLARGRIVVCDRFTDATVCYQGYAGGVDLKSIDTLNAAATGGLKPDLTILLDIDTVTGLGRAKSKGPDRMERKKLIYHKRVRAGYLKLAKKFPRRIKVIKVSGSIEDTQALVRREAERVI
ncbi:MAG: dTMP kinase [Candidatus Omnitrophota bacterium]|nr:dTMP kinase [Candidatus Omnitrophota bacterium]